MKKYLIIIMMSAIASWSSMSQQVMANGGGLVIVVPPGPTPPPPPSGAPKGAKGGSGNIAGAFIAKEVGGIMLGGAIAYGMAERKMRQKGRCNGLTGAEIRAAFSGSTVATIFMAVGRVKDEPCQINRTQSRNMGPGVPGYEFSSSIDRSCTYYSEYKRRKMGYCKAYISRKCLRNAKYCQRAGGRLQKRSAKHRLSPKKGKRLLAKKRRSLFGINP